MTLENKSTRRLSLGSFKASSAVVDVRTITGGAGGGRLDVCHIDPPGPVTPPIVTQSGNLM